MTFHLSHRLLVKALVVILQYQSCSSLFLESWGNLDDYIDSGDRRSMLQEHAICITTIEEWILNITPNHSKNLYLNCAKNSSTHASVLKEEQKAGNLATTSPS